MRSRQGAAKGRKVLYIWDRAGIDFRQGFEWKNQSGIYFLSREKDNMKLEVVGKNPFDTTLPINTGILADEMVATCQGVSVRRVIYQDPETRIIYHYLTNLPASIPPGLIALLYKARWDIEKVFDEFKTNSVKPKPGPAVPPPKPAPAAMAPNQVQAAQTLAPSITPSSGSPSGP